MKKLPIVFVALCLSVTIFMAVPAHAAGITYLKSSLYWNINDNTFSFVNNADNVGTEIYNSVSFTNKTSVPFSDIVFDTSIITDTFTSTSDWYSQVITLSDFNTDELTHDFRQLSIYFYRPIVLTAGQTLEFYFYITSFYRYYVSDGVETSSGLNRIRNSTGVRYVSTAGPPFLNDSDGISRYGDGTVTYYTTSTSSAYDHFNLCYRAKYTASSNITLTSFNVSLVTTGAINDVNFTRTSFVLVGSPLCIYDAGYNPGFEEPTSPAESEIISGIDAVESQQNQMNQTLDDINDKLEETYVVPEPEVLPGYNVGELIDESEAVESASDLMEAVESSMNTEDMLSGSRFWQSLISEIISVPGFAVMGMMSGGFLITKAFIGR